MPEKEYGIEDEVYQALLKRGRRAEHPERYVLGKPHADRAKQFKPFAALRGYEESIAKVMSEASESHDFSELEDPC